MSFCSHSGGIEVIAMKFCSRHDSCAVVACKKLCSDMIPNNGVTPKPIFRRVRITMEKPSVKWAPVPTLLPLFQDGFHANGFLCNLSGSLVTWMELRRKGIFPYFTMQYVLGVCCKLLCWINISESETHDVASYILDLYCKLLCWINISESETHDVASPDQDLGLLS